MGITALLVVASLTGCKFNVQAHFIEDGIKGSGVMKTESRSVSGYHAIALNGVGTLKITQDGTESVSITAEDNLLPLIESKVENGTLTLGPADGKSINPTKSIDFDVHVKSLSNLGLAGAGTVDATGIKGDKLAIDVSGTGLLNVEGKVDDLSLTLSGAGNYEGKKLESKSATIQSSGAGRAVVNASDTLTVNISGLGKVDYVGSPKITKDISGLGSVTHVD
jgi:hypothetical protein